MNHSKRTFYLAFQLLFFILFSFNIVAQGQTRFSFGAHVNTQKHQVTFDSPDLIELSDWNQTTTFVGFDLGIQLKDQIRLVTGINYKQLKYTLTDFNPSSIFFCNDFDISYMVETYRSDYLGIPILVEYQLAKDCKLCPNIIGGLINYVALNPESETQLVICGSEIVSEGLLFPETEQEILQVAYLGAALKIPIFDKFAIAIEPNVHYHLNELLNQPSDLFFGLVEAEISSTVYSYGLALRLIMRP